MFLRDRIPYCYCNMLQEGHVPNPMFSAGPKRTILPWPFARTIFPQLQGKITFQRNLQQDPRNGPLNLSGLYLIALATYLGGQLVRSHSIFDGHFNIFRCGSTSLVVEKLQHLHFSLRKGVESHIFNTVGSGVSRSWRWGGNQCQRFQLGWDWSQLAWNLDTYGFSGSEIR